jgi:hypothetical protein
VLLLPFKLLTPLIKIFAVVIPVVNDAVPELKLVETAFVIVLFVALRTPELTDVVANKVAVVIFVSTIFVDVILTTVRLPATFKFPDKLILPPVIVVAESKVDETVPNEPIVEYNVLVEIFVATIFVDVAFVETMLVISALADVNPLDRLRVELETFV